jgi:hypothetical protein
MTINDKCTVRLSGIVMAAIAANATAAPPSASSYYTDAQSSHVEDATSRGIGHVNMITCFISAMRPDALVNEGNYIALVDETKCDPEARGSSSGAGSEGAQAASYTTALVNSSRASNSDPMIAKIWIDEVDDGVQSSTYVRTSATEAPSDTNPYGQFRLDFCGKAAGMPSCMMGGFIDAGASGLSFYQHEEDDNGEASTVALRLTASGTSSGSGRMFMDRHDGQGEFAFAYDQNLFLRSDGTDQQCFSRDASDPDTGLSVWRYGLYDEQTGERVERNSGFPIELTSGGTTHHGYLGYYGLSLPPEAASALTNGTTVQKVDYSSGDEPTRTAYTVMVAGGKLTKYTKHTRTLHSMDQIKFNTWVGPDAASFFAGAEPNTQYELYWDDAEGHFVATGQQSCGENGCQVADLPSPETVDVSYWASRGGVQGWSQSLGGEVFVNLQGVSNPIDSAAVQVVFRSQDLVYPTDLPATLYCLQNCPTAATMSSYFAPASADGSPYVASTFNAWGPVVPANVVTYSSDASTGTLQDDAGEPVTFTDSEAYGAHPQYQFGVRTGRLFTNLAAAQCEADPSKYCDARVNELEVFYQWETGPQPWNQFAAVKDANDAFVTFDPPLQLNYQVPAGAQYGQYAGKSIVLQYSGFGNLWGIPGECVSRLTNEPLSCDDPDARHVPAFVIPFDVTSGRVTDASASTGYLVKWLDREIRFAKKSTTTCTSAGLTAPTGVTLPTVADLKDPSDPASDIYIGTKPTVTDAPRVIHGDVKY